MISKCCYKRVKLHILSARAGLHAFILHAKKPPARNHGQKSKQMPSKLAERQSSEAASSLAFPITYLPWLLKYVTYLRFQATTPFLKTMRGPLSKHRIPPPNDSSSG